MDLLEFTMKTRHLVLFDAEKYDFTTGLDIL